MTDSKKNIIKIKSIEFGEPAFRKLKNISVPIASRLTVIAGHNGLGKSTILGLIANASGFPRGRIKSYFDRNFNAPIEDVFFLSPKFDYKEERNSKPNVRLIYEKNEEITIKRCNVTKNDDLARLRVHPRTITVINGKEKTGSAAKVPIPTVYVGMSRMYPIGENEDPKIERPPAKVHADDAIYINNCFSQILGIEIASQTSVEAYNISGIKKSSKVPHLGIDTLAISLGQDSVSVLVTALASFKRLKRELGDNYNGGILAIDEVEAGLHPHAQVRLIKLLKREARQLDLQIIMTSHSLTIIKEIFATRHEETDAVRYFMNSNNPILLNEGSYLRIKNDMLANPLLEADSAPIQKIYFEDNEALFFFEQILVALKIDIKEKYGIQLKLISTKLGCHNLLQMASADDDFNSIIIIFDNDIVTSEANRRILSENKNFLALPDDIIVDDSTPGSLRNPEAIAFSYLDKVTREDGNEKYSDFWYRSVQLTNYSSDSTRHICEEFRDNNYDRDKNKSLFNRHKEFFARSQLIQTWARENETNCLKMVSDLDTAIKHCAFLRPRNP
ncbi:MAG: AAA family ATPase [Alcaligenes faecalis]